MFRDSLTSVENKYHCRPCENSALGNLPMKLIYKIIYFLLDFFHFSHFINKKRVCSGSGVYSEKFSLSHNISNVRKCERIQKPTSFAYKNKQNHNRQFSLFDNKNLNKILRLIIVKIADISQRGHHNIINRKNTILLNNEMSRCSIYFEKFFFTHYTIQEIK